MSEAESYWNKALSFFKEGNKEQAFSIFDSYILKREITRGECSWSLTEAEPENRDVSSFIEFMCKQYLKEHDLYHLDAMEGFFDLPVSIKKEMAIQFLHWKPMHILGEDGHELKGGELLRAQEVVGICRAWELYREIRQKNRTFEDLVISHADSLERYDYVLFSLEEFGRLKEAVEFLDETPPHLVWPDSTEPEKERIKYREKLEFKLKRVHSTKAEKSRTYSKEEIERMFALGEITKTEYEKMKASLEEGKSKPK